MAKRMLGLFLALCLVIGLLPVITLAEDTETKTATLTINTGTNITRKYWNPSLSAGMNPAYAKTTSDGFVTTEGASASDWNLMVEWPVDGKPTLTMKAATIRNANVNTSSTSDKHSTVRHTINIGGTADFVIMLQGTNTLTDCWDAGGAGQATGRNCNSIVAKNEGTLTIKGNSKADSLIIDNAGGHCILKHYNALTLEKATFSLIMNKTNQGSQTGIALMYETEDRKDLTNLTVRDADLSIKSTTKYNTVRGIQLTNTIADNAISEATANIDNNTGDLRFENSIVYFYRNNSGGQSAPFVYYGSQSTCTFDRCDVTSYAWRIMFNDLPTITNYASASYRQEITSSSYKDYTYNPELADTPMKVRKITSTHACKAGAPVTVKPEGVCAATQTTLTYCIVCDKELSRVVEDLGTDPSKIHTPGAKRELTDKRVGIIDGTTYGKYGLEITSTSADGKTDYLKVKTGKYVFECTCSVCGEIWLEEEEFKPAMLFFLTSGKGSWYAGGGYYNYNTAESGNAKTGYYPTVAIEPGQVKYYTTGEYDSNNPGYSYMKALTDEAEIAAGNWNVKFEYPLYGNPILTLRDATIINNAGLWYGYAGYRDMAPLTIVLEGNNRLEQRYSTTGCGPLTLQTNNDVTITGDGTLHLESYGQGRGLGTLDGHLTLDHVKITMVRANTFVGSTKGIAIGSRTNGDVTINGGSLTYLGYGETISSAKTNEETGVTTVTNSFTAAHTNLIRGRNVTINDAIITAHGTFSTEDASSNCYTGIIYASNDLTITESTLMLAHGYAYEIDEANTYNIQDIGNVDALKCGGTLKLNYANGVTGKTADGYTHANAHIGATSTIYPTTMTDITSIDQAVAARGNRYLQIAPVAPLSDFVNTAVTLKENLNVDFLLDPTVVEGIEGTVEFTVDGVKLDPKPLSEVGKLETDGFVITLPNLAAKDINKEISVLVKDAEGNTLTSTKTDSVLNYALRLLRNDKYADDSVAGNKELKTLLVDMLIYGSMAQVQFHKGETAVAAADLATAVLTPDEWAYASEVKAPEKVAATPSAEGYLGTAFELKSDIGMAIALDAALMADADYAKVTFTDYLGEAKEFTVTEKDVTSTDKYTIYVFKDLDAANGRQVIRWEIFNANDESLLTVEDSLAGYVGRMREDYPYLDELLKYCDSAEAYFKIPNRHQ